MPLRHLNDSQDDIDNQSAAWLAKQADPDGTRTIGELAMREEYLIHFP